jgi:hypothetical protein
MIENQEVIKVDADTIQIQINPGYIGGSSASNGLLLNY